METKYQRAKRLLLDEYYQTPKRWKDYQIISEAIEKETPLIIKEETRDTFTNGDRKTSHTTYRCPNCGNLIHLTWLSYINYCTSCGQRVIFPNKVNELSKAYEEDCWLSVAQQNAREFNTECGNGGELDDKRN